METYFRFNVLYEMFVPVEQELEKNQSLQDQNQNDDPLRKKLERFVFENLTSEALYNQFVPLEESFETQADGDKEDDGLEEDFETQARSGEVVKHLLALPRIAREVAGFILQHKDRKPNEKKKAHARFLNSLLHAAGKMVICDNMAVMNTGLHLISVAVAMGADDAQANYFYGMYEGNVYEGRASYDAALQEARMPYVANRFLPPCSNPIWLGEPNQSDDMIAVSQLREEYVRHVDLIADGLFKAAAAIPPGTRLAAKLHHEADEAMFRLGKTRFDDYRDFVINNISICRDPVSYPEAPALFMKSYIQTMGLVDDYVENVSTGAELSDLKNILGIQMLLDGVIIMHLFDFQARDDMPEPVGYAVDAFVAHTLRLADMELDWALESLSEIHKICTDGRLSEQAPADGTAALKRLTEELLEGDLLRNEPAKLKTPRSRMAQKLLASTSLSSCLRDENPALSSSPGPTPS